MTAFPVKERTLFKITVSTPGEKDDAENDRVVADGRKKSVPIEDKNGLHEGERDRLRALAWRFRDSRSCHWGGVDRSGPLVDYATGLLSAGVDHKQVLQAFLCAIRCCGDCEQ